MARTPEQIGKYTIVEQIGKGGMGLVYKAEHPTLDRFVILKKLTIAGDAAIRERFRREAQIMIDFRTDYVVDVYDHFRQGSSDYIVLEYIDGVSLDELLADERYLESDLALFILRDCLRGLDYVHRKGVVHRDVKPGNVLIGRDGSVKLLDFGIAARAAEASEADERLTREGMTLGTVAYIAPEQIERSHAVDLRADIYSAGAMLYEMITGRKAFVGGFNPETVNRIQRGRYRRARRVNPRVSRLAARVSARAMRRNPRRRFQRAADIVALLDRFFRGRDESELRACVAALAGGPAPPERRPRRALRWIAVTAISLGVVAVAFGALWMAGLAQPIVVGNTHVRAQLVLRLHKSDRIFTEHLVRLSLERESPNGRVEVPIVLPLLHPVRSLETPDYTVARSRLLTLPAGRYRVDVRVDDLVTHELALLRAPSDEVRVLSFQWDPTPRDALAIRIDVQDALSGAPINDAAISYWDEQRWIDLVRRGDAWFERPGSDASALPFGAGSGFMLTPPARRLELAPGTTVRLRVSKPGYEAAEISARSFPDTATLRVVVALTSTDQMEESR